MYHDVCHSPFLISLFCLYNPIISNSKQFMLIQLPFMFDEEANLDINCDAREREREREREHYVSCFPTFT